MKAKVSEAEYLPLMYLKDSHDETASDYRNAAIFHETMSRLILLSLIRKGMTIVRWLGEDAPVELETGDGVGEDFLFDLLAGNPGEGTDGMVEISTDKNRKEGCEVYTKGRGLDAYIKEDLETVLRSKQKSRHTEPILRFLFSDALVDAANADIKEGDDN